jgi:hypothetical protein
VSVYPLVVARQRHGKHLPAATNTHPTIELLDAVFSFHVVSNTQYVVKESRRFVLLGTHHICLRSNGKKFKDENYTVV